MDQTWFIQCHVLQERPGRSFWLLAINDGQIAMVPIASVQAYIDYPNKFFDVRYKAQCYDRVHSSLVLSL